MKSLNTLDIPLCIDTKRLSPLLRTLFQFQQNPVGSDWMHKSDAVSLGTDTRGLIYQSDTGGFQFTKAGFEVVDEYTDMVKPLAAR